MGVILLKVLTYEGLQRLVAKIKASTVACAQKLSNTSAIGSATKPVYFNANGVPVAGTYTLGAACAKDVSTSVTSGDSNLVTGGAVSSAISAATNYEEGTFTGNLYNGSVSSIKTATGKYRRVGNMVYVYIAILNTSSNVPDGMSGLPFPHLGAISPANKSELFYYHCSKKVLLRANQISVGNTILFDSGTVPTGDFIEVFGWYRINTDAL